MRVMRWSGGDGSGKVISLYEQTDMHPVTFTTFGPPVPRFPISGCSLAGTFKK
jgi:hypothetical protein